jgi:hypothetical protein
MEVVAPNVCCSPRTFSKGSKTQDEDVNLGRSSSESTHAILARNWHAVVRCAHIVVALSESDDVMLKTVPTVPTHAYQLQWTPVSLDNGLQDEVKLSRILVINESSIVGSSGDATLPVSADHSKLPHTLVSTLADNKNGEIGARLAASADIERLSDTGCVAVRGLPLLLMDVWNPRALDDAPDCVDSLMCHSANSTHEKKTSSTVATVNIGVRNMLKITNLWSALSLVSLESKHAGVPVLMWLDDESSNLVKCGDSSFAKSVALDVKERQRAVYIIAISHTIVETEHKSASPLSSHSSKPLSSSTSTCDLSNSKTSLPMPATEGGSSLPLPLLAESAIDVKDNFTEDDAPLPSWIHASFFTPDTSRDKQPLGQNTLLARAVDCAHRKLWNETTRQDTSVGDDMEPHWLALVVDRDIGFVVQAYYGIYSGHEWLAFDSELKCAEGLPAPASERYHRLRPLDPAPAHRGMLDSARLREFALDVDKLAASHDDQRARFARISGIVKDATLIPTSYHVSFTRCIY